MSFYVTWVILFFRSLSEHLWMSIVWVSHMISLPTLRLAFVSVFLSLALPVLSLALARYIRIRQEAPRNVSRERGAEKVMRELLISGPCAIGFSVKSQTLAISARNVSRSMISFSTQCVNFRRSPTFSFLAMDFLRVPTIYLSFNITIIVNNDGCHLWCINICWLLWNTMSLTKYVEAHSLLS